MRNKLITLSYLFDGDVNKITKAVKCGIEVEINYKFIDSLDKQGVGVITILDDNYPEKLLHLYNPPYVIYYCGNVELLSAQIFAIIGARKNTSYSEKVCLKLVEQIKDKVIISGLALGIDTCAHRFAIMNNLYTIAVLGSGFNNLYPYTNKDLASEIATNHLLISEYPPHIKASRHNFPMRNRIIAALCEELYVIQAASKSGSLITANLALELGKTIYCAPGSIFEEQYYGSHSLINDGAFLLEFRNEVDL